MSQKNTGHCAECGRESITCGDRAGVRAGRLLCSDCADRDVVYHTECLSCDWEYSITESAFNWYDARLRVQQEGNSHEDEKRVFAEENHETVWRRVHDLSEEVVARAE